MYPLLLVYLSIASSFAQSMKFGHCPDVQTVSSFDAKKYAGVWFEQVRSFPNVFEFAGMCVTANYTVTENGTITVVNKEISFITEIPYSIEGEAVVDVDACGNSPGCSKLIVKFSLPIIGEVDGTYWVLDTDYTSYSVVWSCTEYYPLHVSFAWILTRDQIPLESLVDNARQVLKNNNIDNLFMTTTDQKNCS